MKAYKMAKVKWNGGQGSLLCNKCSKVIDLGLDHKDEQHLCRDCKIKTEEKGERA